MLWAGNHLQTSSPPRLSSRPTLEEAQLQRLLYQPSPTPKGAQRRRRLNTPRSTQEETPMHKRLEWRHQGQRTPPRMRGCSADATQAIATTSTSGSAGNKALAYSEESSPPQVALAEADIGGWHRQNHLRGKIEQEQRQLRDDGPPLLEGTQHTHRKLSVGTKVANDGVWWGTHPPPPQKTTTDTVIYPSLYL